jgi:hypothetical protein
LCAYGVKETTDLDMLGIDNSQTSREAHTALAQIAWFEDYPEAFEWAVAVSRKGLESLLTNEGGSSHEAEILGRLGDMKIRNDLGMLTPWFVEWYDVCCPFEEGGLYRALSYQCLIRGDYVDFHDASDDGACEQYADSNGEFVKKTGPLRESDSAGLQSSKRVVRSELGRRSSGRKPGKEIEKTKLKRAVANFLQAKWAPHYGGAFSGQQAFNKLYFAAGDSDPDLVDEIGRVNPEFKDYQYKISSVPKKNKAGFIVGKEKAVTLYIEQNGKIIISFDWRESTFINNWGGLISGRKL